MSTPESDVRVCFVGDSYVAGAGDSDGLGWAGRVVVAALAASGLNLTSYNLGVRGETSVQIARRLPSEAAPRLAPAEDPRIILSFGVNDTVLDGGEVRTKQSDTLQALREIHAAVGPVRLFFVGPPAAVEDEHNQRIAQTSEALETQCGELGIPFLNTFERTRTDAVWQQQIRDGDGFHPDAQGYEVIASIAATPIVDWLSAR